MNASALELNKKELEDILSKGTSDSDLKPSSESCMKLLKALENSSVTLSLLSSTKIGVVVNNVKKAYAKVDESVSKTAANVVSKWKKVAAESRKENQNNEGERSSKRPRTEVNYNEDAILDSAAASSGKSVYSNGTKEANSKLRTKISNKTMPLPTRDANTNEFVFKDRPEFRPNLSPSEVLQMGSFGGTYFRPIKSSVTNIAYGDEVWKELPQDWLKGLNIKTQVASSTYKERNNRYGVKCGGSLEMWEESGWMRDSDPYGWFQWYCRFFQGRRCSDDDRQIARGLQCMGPTGRWRGNLAGKILSSVNGKKTLESQCEDYKISPVIRQTLQHWGYRINVRDLMAYKKRKGL